MRRACEFVKPFSSPSFTSCISKPLWTNFDGNLTHIIVKYSACLSIAADPVNFTNWALGRNGRFNNHFVEDCVVFLPYWNHGQWDDVQCGATSPDYEQVQENHYFICQFRKFDLTPLT